MAVDREPSDWQREALEHFDRIGAQRVTPEDWAALAARTASRQFEGIATERGPDWMSKRLPERSQGTHERPPSAVRGSLSVLALLAILRWLFRGGTASRARHRARQRRRGF